MVSLTLEVRFWGKVDRRDEDGCWLWTGAKTTAGYGSLLVSLNPKRNGYAHRVSWELHNGPIPEGLDVCHHCDTPACCRPDHLFVGTAKDNLSDMAAKGRSRAGEDAPVSKLTNKDVEFIRSEVTLLQREVAAMFGIHQSTVSYIRTGKTWKRVRDSSAVNL